MKQVVKQTFFLKKNQIVYNNLNKLMQMNFHNGSSSKAILHFTNSPWESILEILIAIYNNQKLRTNSKQSIFVQVIDLKFLKTYSHDLFWKLLRIVGYCNGGKNLLIHIRPIKAQPWGLYWDKEIEKGIRFVIKL